MNSKFQVKSPILFFIFLIVILELFFRLPYVLSIKANPFLNRKTYNGYFSNFSSETVINTGLILLACAILVMLIAASLNKMGKYTAFEFKLPKIPFAISIIALILSGFSLYMISQLSADIAYIEDIDISSKRSGFSDNLLLYLILRLSMFNHIVIALAYVRAIQTNGLFAWISFVIPALIFLITLTFISHRALLFVFVLEIAYLQILLRRLNMRRIFILGLFLVSLILTITVLRVNQEHANLFEAIGFGIGKALQSRYFFDFTKLGVGFLWATEINWMGPISISFIFEPFFGEDILSYKDIGKILARRAFNIHVETGITPGGYLEALLSFGLIGGVLFFGLIFYIFLFFERYLFEAQIGFALKVYLIFTISKIVLVLNSSFGAFCFQLFAETLLFILIVLPFLRHAEKTQRFA